MKKIKWISLKKILKHFTEEKKVPFNYTTDKNYF